MAEEKGKPLTREDVLRLIEENGGKAEELDLSGKIFEKGVDLSELNLSGIILKEAKFPVRWEGAKAIGDRFDRSDLTKADLRNIDFSEAYFNGTKLQGAFIGGADFTDAHLGGADWGDYKIGEEKEGEKEKDQEKKKEYLKTAEHRYRQLKAWYDKSGYGDTAGKFYYREKEANRKSLKWCLRSWNDRLASEVIRGLLGYGERWWNVLYWIAALILLFAFTYLAIFTTWEWWQIILSWILGLIVLFTCINVAMSLTWMWWQRIPVWATGFILLFPAVYFLGRSVSSAWDFWDALYFSAVSFTALGYGGWIKLGSSLANDFTRGLGAFESLVGISTMALLLVTFFRKWTR